MRRQGIVRSLLALAVLWLMCPSPSGAQAQADEVTAAQKAAAEAKIRAALRDRTQLVFIDAPLKDAMNYLAIQHDIKIVVDEAAFQEWNFSSRVGVDARVEAETFRDALTELLSPLHLTYEIDDGALKILPVAEIIERKLEESTRLIAEDEPLDTVVSDVSGMLGFPVVLGEATLRKHGVASDAKVSVEAVNKPFGDALSQMLKPLKLKHYVHQEGRLVITVDEMTQP